MLDILIVTAFVLYGLGSGLRARSKASQSLDEYFLAGRTIKGWRAGVSMAATQFAADTPLLVAGLVASAGVFALWRLWIYGLAFLLLAWLFASNWRRAGVLTDAEVTRVRYSGKAVVPLRLFKAVYYGTVINCVVLAMVLVAAIRIAEVFLPWQDWLPAGLYQGIASVIEASGIRLGESITGLDALTTSTNNLISIVLILVFTATYSITGGLRAVVQTDVMQFAVAMLGTAAYAWFVVDAAGGLGGLTERIVELYGLEQADKLLSFAPPAGVGEALLPFLVIVGMQWLFQMNADGTGYLAQRSMACPTDRQARIAGLVFTWLQILVRSLFWLAISLGLLVLYPFTPADAAGDGFVAAREALFVSGIDELLPPGIRGLMLVGLLAALASTVDTHLNWGASYWSNDVYRAVVAPKLLKREARDAELVLVARLSNVVILLIAMAIMANLGSIQTAWFISLLFGAGMGAVLVLRWLWERINLYSELAAMLVSLITAPLLLHFFGTDQEQEWIRLGLMSLITSSAAILVTFVTPATDDATLQAFYRKVRPFGFWGRTAALCGDDGRARADFRSRVLAVVLTALSLYSLLIGIGRLAFPAPEGGQWLSWLCLAFGLALLPVWLPMALGNRFERPAEPLVAERD
ncbi:sodium:solute symporter family protein [Pseudomonas oligotrophica]|uniref:sodium:solute symporter family protein n=1 Tax=Pseudomonas oligotrophica TaxID=2912055 RepID=UPI001F26F441|nr:sodium:solute symporter family protein [Pseudomonas oligotrophica]MCF7202698.1 Na+:solute symporter [Pseudomonas oligotrophica]